MSKLAIRGDLNRGHEVIEILEMLGGKNSKYCTSGSSTDSFYFIDDDNAIDFYCLNTPTNYRIFTLEEFYKEFPYKVGNKVKTIYGKISIVEQLVWSNKYNAVRYELEDDENSLYFANELRLCEEETMEEELMPKIDFSKYSKNKYLLDIGDYEIKVEDGKTYVVRKKPQYQKTYEECCDILNIHHDRNSVCNGLTHKATNYDLKLFSLLETFRQLIVCRDAYWKIAGEEMGLGKPWEPDFKDNQDKYFICYLRDELWMSNIKDCNRVLVFPTEEMRDIFYENFKDLIEECKELL